MFSHIPIYSEKREQLCNDNTITTMKDDSHLAYYWYVLQSAMSMAHASQTCYTFKNIDTSH